MRALFTADPGRYRVLVFTVTDVPVTDVGPTVEIAEAMEWLHTGGKSLPLEISQLRWREGFACVLLVYEFVRVERTAYFVSSSNINPWEYVWRIWYQALTTGGFS